VTNPNVSHHHTALCCAPSGGPSSHPVVHSADSSPKPSVRQPAAPAAELSPSDSAADPASAPAAGTAPPGATAAAAAQLQPLGQRLLSRLSRSSGSAAAAAASEAAQPHGRHQSTVSIDLRSTPDVEQPAQPEGALLSRQHSLLSWRTRTLPIVVVIEECQTQPSW
jgi:hypothetical protein